MEHRAYFGWFRKFGLKHDDVNKADIGRPIGLCESIHKCIVMGSTARCRVTIDPTLQNRCIRACIRKCHVLQNWRLRFIGSALSVNRGYRYQLEQYLFLFGLGDLGLDMAVILGLIDYVIGGLDYDAVRFAQLPDIIAIANNGG